MLKNEKESKAVVENTTKIKSEGEKPVDGKSFVRKVEKKAYELCEKRGFECGHEWDDWFEAEKIVESEISTVDRDCIRSESLYEISHRSSPLPSYIDPQKINPKHL